MPSLRDEGSGGGGGGEDSEVDDEARAGMEMRPCWSLCRHAKGSGAVNGLQEVASSRISSVKNLDIVICGYSGSTIVGAEWGVGGRVRKFGG